MDRLPRIPTPPSQRWREFRVRLFPFFVFAAAAAAVTFLWRDNVGAPTLLGEVESIKSNVSSTKSGKLSQLNVSRLQRVRAGDTIAQVIITDPQVLESSLAVIHAEIQLLRVNLQPVLGQQRYALTYDRLRLDWMDQRVQLATARVRLQLAETELRRNQELFKEKVISQQAVDAAKSNKDRLEAEVQERSTLVAELEQKLKELSFAENSAGFPKDSNPEDVMRASIKVQEEKLHLTEAELRPIPLVVPMDGVISTIHHRSGEAVVAGEPIVTLTAITPDRILGYMRQPISMQPKVGMKVEVRSRSLNHCVSEAEILEVGSHMETIGSTLSPMPNVHVHEVGLPVLVSLPRSQKLVPGEIVDLRILPSKGGFVHGADAGEIR